MITPICGSNVDFRVGARFRRVGAGFTLIEMLIVITIIGILAALAFPATTAVIAMANGIKCSNNLRQLAMGVGGYSMSNNEETPDFIMDLKIEGFGKKVFICPFDKNRGQDIYMGRYKNAPWGKYDQLWERDCSYMYEFSSTTKDVPQSCGVTGKKFDAGLLSWFFRNVQDPSSVPAEKWNWADGKRNQQALGNLSKPAVPTKKDPTFDCFGAPFSTSEVPIIRCFHHCVWGTPIPPKDGHPSWKTPKVNNVFMDMSVGMNWSYWEYQANPGFDPDVK